MSPGITGLLGPNGAGKTTLLRMITGLARVSDGTITVFGQPIRDNPPLYRRIDVMSERETVYGFMNATAPRPCRYAEESLQPSYVRWIIHDAIVDYPRLPRVSACLRVPWS